MEQSNTQVPRSFLRRHRIKITVVVVFVLLIVGYNIAAYVVNTFYQFPNEHEFALLGRKTIIDNQDSYPGRMFFVTYDNNGNIANKILLPPAAGAIGTPYSKVTILSDGTIVFVDGISNDRNYYSLKEVKDGVVKDIGEIPTCGTAGYPPPEPTEKWDCPLSGNPPKCGYRKIPSKPDNRLHCIIPEGLNPVTNYLTESGKLDKVDSSIGTVRVDVSGIPFLVDSNASGAGLWVVNLFYAYVHQVLTVVEKNGTTKPVYAFDELTTGTDLRQMSVEGYSEDKSLAIIRLIQRNNHNDVVIQRYYAYDIAHDKWALLTDNPNERVIALR